MQEYADIIITFDIQTLKVWLLPLI